MILTGIDSSTVGDGKSQRMLGVLECDRGSTSFSPLATRKTSGLADRTALKYVPLEKLWWGESDLHSPLARLPCFIIRETD